MLGSITFRALGIHARRILDHLMYEHIAHGGQENGKLTASYKQLEKLGSTEADIPKGLDELYITGFVVRTRQGLRQAGGGEPALYALTWTERFAKTAAETPATHEWKAVIEKLGTEGVGSVSAAKEWLREQVGDTRRRGTKKRKTTPHLQLVSPTTCGAAEAA
jgi:predicted transcriptional regulator